MDLGLQNTLTRIALNGQRPKDLSSSLLRCQQQARAYFAFVILMDPALPFQLSGGPTEEEAWRNAYIKLGQYKEA